MYIHMNPLHRYAVRCPAFRFYVDFLMNHRNHQPLHNILVLVGNINPVRVYPIAAGFVPAAVLLLSVFNAIFVYDHIGIRRNRAFAAALRRGCLRNICRKCGWDSGCHHSCCAQCTEKSCLHDSSLLYECHSSVLIKFSFGFG